MMSDSHEIQFVFGCQSWKSADGMAWHGGQTSIATADE